MKLHMEKAIYGGASLARAPEDAAEGLAGKAVFVPMALPGELVEASIATQRRGYVTASLNSVLEPAPYRIAPPCDYYARCGGCHYQHAGYSAQLEMKRAILAETLERAHVAISSSIRVLSGEPWGYRNRIRLHVAQQPQPALCYREPASHRDLAVDHCPVAAPVLQQAIAAITRVLRAQPQIAQTLAEVELFAIADDSALLLSLFVHQPLPQPQLHSFADALHRELPALQGARAFSVDPKSHRAQAVATWGEPALDYTVGTLHYRVSAGAFFQVNRFLIPALLKEVTADRQGRLAWDLYSGVGLFAQVLAQSFERVVAVESAAASAADLRRNLQGSTHECVSMDTQRFLAKHSSQPPDLVILDPPRAGLGPEVCVLLAAAGPKQIVYVSCDPATLARDLRALQPSGYRPTALTLVDLFPQTFHLETVATLERT